MPSIPSVIGSYQVLSQLGRGGMGTLYLANDPRLDRRIAIKVLSGDLDHDGIRDRFAREARAIARLNHPNIVSIFELGEHEGQPFIAMEYIDGRTLGQMIRAREAIPFARKLQIMEELCAGLAHAHRAGFVHRDIKPANVMVDSDGVVKILDFGIVRFADSGGATKTGSLIGTLGYMSPEQVTGEPVDNRSDIFSVGALFYEFLAYKQAFQGELPSVLQKILTGEPEPLSAIVPDLDPAVLQIVDRCLEKAPDRRYQDLDDMKADLRAIRDGLTQTDATVVLERPRLPDAHRNATAPAAAPPAPRPAPPPPPPAATAQTQDWAQGTRAGPVLTLIDGRRADRREEFGDALPPRTAIDRFTIHEVLYRGQTGYLYKAYDPVRSRLLGLKVVVDQSGTAAKRLIRASRIWIDLIHPNLQRIYEVNPRDAEGRALILSELIEGRNLGEVLGDRELDLSQKLRIVLQTCDALEYLHSQGVVHREITPKNIVLSGPELTVKLLDSGLAREVSAAGERYTVIGSVVGDRAYAAPEVARGRGDERSDLYSLGLVLQQMLSTNQQTLVSPDRQTVPGTLARTLAKVLAQDPANRFGSAREFADHLRMLLPEKPKPVELSAVIITLHGIRTHASWQRGFSEVASRAGLDCRLDRWNFGYFSILHFLTPWSRGAKVQWFRKTYNDEFGSQAPSALSVERPSIVAHSFGTYILGHALVRYPFLRFNKVLLCGSILPESFPWPALIERGQVHAVRNEFGNRDVWSRMAAYFVPGTGASGIDGFSLTHDRIEQERFNYAHSEYFERGHMQDRWLPFLRRREGFLPPKEVDIPRIPQRIAAGAMVLYIAVSLGFAASVAYIWSRVG